jgi:hypothetical protein
VRRRYHKVRLFSLGLKRPAHTCWCRIPWHGSGTITKGAECSCETRKGTSFWPGGSTGSQVFLEGSVTYQHWEEFMEVISHQCLQYSHSSYRFQMPSTNCNRQPPSVMVAQLKNNIPPLNSFIITSSQSDICHSTFVAATKRHPTTTPDPRF